MMLPFKAAVLPQVVQCQRTVLCTGLRQQQAALKHGIRQHRQPDADAAVPAAGVCIGAAGTDDLLQLTHVPLIRILHQHLVCLTRHLHPAADALLLLHQKTIDEPFFLQQRPAAQRQKLCLHRHTVLERGRHRLHTEDQARILRAQLRQHCR